MTWVEEVNLIKSKRLSSGMTTFDSTDSAHQDLHRLQQLLLENQRLKDENVKLEQLRDRESFKQHREYRDPDEEVRKQDLELEDVDITIQKGLVHQDEEMLALEQKIRLHCSKFQKKVVDTSNQLTNLRNLTINQHTISNTLEKDYLLRRSYALCQQLEQEERDYIGDCPENIPRDEEQFGELEIKHMFLNDLKKVKTVINQLNGQVSDKIIQIDSLKQENQQIIKEFDGLASKFKEIIAVAHHDNAKLTKTISDMAKKQAQFDEILRIESDINSMHSEVASFDSGILLTEKRLGLIQKSYDKLSQELLRRNELISQRDTKIAKLESYIRDSEIVNRYVHDKCGWNKSSSRVSSELSMESSSNKILVPTETSNEEKIKRLTWLAAALSKKLKKKKEKEKQEKQVVMNLTVLICSTWELLQKNWKTMQDENQNLKHQLTVAFSKSQATEFPLEDSPPCTCLRNLPLSDDDDSRESIIGNGGESRFAECRVSLHPNLFDEGALFDRTALLLTSSAKHPASSCGEVSLENPNPSRDSTYDLNQVSQLMEECQRAIRILRNP
ncbi:unnamed protein product [Allacma fusca]|uniref:Uncharacterized protein n=1 Tax=Allacma fusca TaxID=39272 RepID=A0A8J2J7M8_9HEXA|nr:unnamed protein product [Allacma fusca]